MPLAGRTGTEVRPTGQSVLSWFCITKEPFTITKDTFSRIFGKCPLDYSQKKAKQKSFRGLLESIEFGVVSVPSLLFPALSHSIITALELAVAESHKNGRVLLLGLSSPSALLCFAQCF